VLDWKTYRRRPSRAWLAQRMQSRVYPLVLVEAGPSLFDRFPAPEDTRTVRPENVEMRYWFAEYPDQPESFRYDTNAYQADREYLAGLIEEIAERVRLGEQAAGAGRPSAFDDVWTLGHDTEACRYCNYRSLCDRGEAAGDPSAALRAGLAAYVEDEQEDYAAEGETDFGFDLDWGQVQEIVY
jgi:hypothetical protein